MAQERSHRKKRKEPAMQKGEAEMKRKNIMTRLEVDPRAIEAIEEIAEHEGRRKQRQLGIILENIFRLHRDDPKKLKELGLLSPPSVLAIA